MNKKILLIALIFVVFFIPNISGLGVTPGRRTINFVPGLEEGVSFSIINSESKDIELYVYVQGELKDAVSIVGNNRFKMKSSESSKAMFYNVKLPDNLSPGLHTAEVVILELPEGVSDAQIGVALAVVTQLNVHVPYPGKYAEAELNILGSKPNEEFKFLIPVSNKGEWDLVSVNADIEIYDNYDNKIFSLATDSISIKSNERKELVGKWIADVPSGVYKVISTINYDGETLQLGKTFSVGEEILKIEKIDVNNFHLGQIAKFEMFVENTWNEPVLDAHTRMQIFNEKGDIMADFKSANYDFEPLSKQVMISYWDTAGVKEGVYNSKLFLVHEGKSYERDLKLDVEENKIEVIGLGYVISSEGDSGNNGLVIILIVLVSVLILINLLWFLVLRKRLKK